jgi:hypothetical protein
MKGFRSYVYLLVETIRRTAQIDSDRGRPYGLGVLDTLLRAAIGGLPACAR